jgi:hypothetical protein
VTSVAHDDLLSRGFFNSIIVPKTISVSNDAQGPAGAVHESISIPRRAPIPSVARCCFLCSPEIIDQARHIFRERAFKDKAATMRRMLEGEQRGMQRGTRESSQGFAYREIASGRRSPATIDGVAGYGMADRGQVHADLMRASGQKSQSQERGAIERLYRFELRGCRTPARSSCGHLVAMDGVAPDRRLHYAPRGMRRSERYGQVDLFNGAPGKLTDKIAMSLVILGND